MSEAKPSSSPVPVTIITGFLGSGKTTLLNSLLRSPALADSAVIVNEFGEIGIDHLLVSTPAENMVLLDSGCLCCTVRGDFVQTLTDLNRKRRDRTIPAFSRVIIETTGLADPVPLLQTIVGDESLSRAYALADVIATVDALHGGAQLDTHPESVKQAAVADVLLITKTDIASREITSALTDRLTHINPGAELHEVSRGAIEPSLLIQSRRNDRVAKYAHVRQWLREAEHEHVSLHEHSNAHAHGAHEREIRSFCVYRDEPIQRAGLTLWLDMLAGLRGRNLLRVKGLLNVEGEPVVIQAVQTVVHEPVVLEAWPDDDRRSRFVFITRNMSRGEIERTFDAFDYAPQATRKALDPAAYARFVAAMKGFS